MPDSAKTTLLLEEGEDLRLYGPLSLTVKKGLLTLLGAELKKGDRVEINRYRSYVAIANESTEVEISVKKGGKIEFPANEEHISEWIKVADSLLDSLEKPSTVAVVGPVESGKTSYTAFLANRALSKGIIPAIIDADIGQADIGPSGFVSLAYAETWVTWLRELNPSLMKFVGSIEPSHVIGKLISSIAKLIEEALKEGAGIVIVDTDGWTQGIQALESKVDLLDSIRSDIVIVLEDELLYNFLKKSIDAPVYYLPSPSIKVARDPSDRKLLRRENYKRFLDSKEVEVDLNKVSVKGSCLLQGTPLSDRSLEKIIVDTLSARVLLISEIPGVLCIGIESKEPPDSQALKALQRKIGRDIIAVYSGAFSRILSSLRDSRGFDHPALLLDINLKEGKALFKTNYDGDIREVIFSRIRLSESFEEIRGRIWI